MELLYLWIEDYKNIYRQGFNFSPLYDFEFKPTKEVDGKVIEGTLTDKMNPTERETKEKFYKDFFKDETTKNTDYGISNVTAIVGENGAGKSSVLHEILNKISEPSNINRYEIKYVYLFIDKENKLCLFRDSEERIRTNFNVRREENNPLKPYYFSNGFTPNDYTPYWEKSYFNNIHKAHDISLNNQSRKIFKNLNKITIPDYFFLCESEIFKNELFFISHILQNKIEIPLAIPQKSLIEIIAHQKSENIKKLEKDIEKIVYKNYQNIYKDKFINFLKKQIFIILLTDIDDSSLDKLKVFLSTYESFEPFVSYFFEGGGFSSNEKRPDENILNHIKDIEKIPDENFTQDGLLLETENKDLLKDFLESYYHTLKRLYHFKWITSDYKILTLSSGEKSLLFLLSSLFVPVDTNYIFFLIDEGEFGLHPQWQKQYLKILLETLPKIFPDKQIQLILTSHSPFLVSDLPKENVIFLRKGRKEIDGEEKEGKSIVDDTFKEQTFGQNIHTLFADSFFLENNGGLMGEFAKEKIYEIVAKIDEGNPTEKEKIRYSIDIIGEPLIRQKLFELYTEQFTDEKEKLQNQIQELQNRLNKLP
ncbi:AAA family ATPase [Bernardetia sp. ABR2-2B]|uniref:AAA family ATPase n=1 Tax=Bernardetia sp. ABR2-2B TaxID=3127472 RepID=UPI0030D3D42A